MIIIEWFNFSCLVSRLSYYFAFFSLDVCPLDMMCVATHFSGYTFHFSAYIQSFFFSFSWVYEHFPSLTASTFSSILWIWIKNKKQFPTWKTRKTKKVNQWWYSNAIFFLYYLKFSRPLLYQDNRQFDSMKERTNDRSCRWIATSWETRQTQSNVNIYPWIWGTKNEEKKEKERTEKKKT